MAIAAVARTGADLVYLNPGFSPDQIADLCRLRGITLVLVDPELADRVPAAIPTLDLTDPFSWAAEGGSAFRISPGGGRHIILTSDHRKTQRRRPVPNTTRPRSPCCQCCPTGNRECM